MQSILQDACCANSIGMQLLCFYIPIFKVAKKKILLNNPLTKNREMIMLKKMFFYLFIVLFVFSLSPSIAREKFQVNQNWKVKSLEKTRDIRRLNIPFEYTQFYKVELNNDKGEKFSVILCKSSDDWIEEAEEHKKIEKIDRATAGAEGIIAAAELATGNVVMGTVTAAKGVVDLIKAEKESEAAEKCYEIAKKEKEKEEEEENKNK
ncbi:MAG: hypothetical protein K940chlam5_00398 [Candidatus Anoxychlamydiales bacterium]|nr:hypothetical protein [Candidatus Anoxychlamydiales bacterium]